MGKKWNVRDGDHLEHLDIDWNTVSRGRRCIYERNIGACPCIHFCRGKEVPHILSVCVCCLRHPACKAHAPYFIAALDLSGCSIFLYVTAQTAVFSVWLGGGGYVFENKMFVLIFSATFV